MCKTILNGCKDNENDEIDKEILEMLHESEKLENERKKLDEERFSIKCEKCRYTGIWCSKIELQPLRSCEKQSKGAKAQYRARGTTKIVKT